VASQIGVIFANTLAVAVLLSVITPTYQKAKLTEEKSSCLIKKIKNPEDIKSPGHELARLRFE